MFDNKPDAPPTPKSGTSRATVLAPTLLGTRGEQGSVAGLVGSVNALTFMLGPLLGYGLYQLEPTSPYILCAVLLVGLTVFVFVHPGLHRAAPVAVAEPVTAEAG